MPVYLFRCTGCARESELLLALGDTGPRPCPECAGEMLQRFSRVAVKYDAFGFTATDRLVADPRGKDFKTLRAKAEQISDE